MNQASLHQMVAAKHSDDKKATHFDELFELRLATNLTLIKDLFFSIYPRATHGKAFKQLLDVLPALHKKRAPTLKAQDIERLQQGNWYQSEKLVGMQLYVDHFTKDLKGLADKLDYFEKLGVNFLHLMPITPRPNGENDGGYAVNSYHEVDPRYGTKKDLLELTEKMRDKNMYLMLDFVANHTSNEYPWAKKAIAGDASYQEYYYTFPDRTVPDAFEATLPEIFPMTSPGNFTYHPKMKRWVMTVFNSYQWDLNYSNPFVFMKMLENLLKLVNLGVDVVRLDALAFMWKKLGTQSQNLPEVHALISLFRLCLQVFAPGVVFLAEAIVAPNDIVKYFGTGATEGNECEIAYNATFMALLWDAIATKKTSLLYKSLQNLPSKPDDTTWINYIRCHDDIGLGFEDRFITEIGWNAQSHRKFLLDYYCQAIEWSPAMGQLFMYNPKTGDGRITGSAASLLGLEKALKQKDDKGLRKAIDKIVMMHGLVLGYNGIPLIYAGDEIGTLNDYTYLTDPDKKDDSRWVNRPSHNWDEVAVLDTGKTYASEIFFALQKLIRLRKQLPVFADQNNLSLYYSHNQHTFLFERTSQDGKGVLVLCNFDEVSHEIDRVELGSYGKQSGTKDLISGKRMKFVSGKLKLQPYQLCWLVKS